MTLWQKWKELWENGWEPTSEEMDQVSQQILILKQKVDQLKQLRQEKIQSNLPIPQELQETWNQLREETKQVIALDPYLEKEELKYRQEKLKYRHEKLKYRQEKHGYSLLEIRHSIWQSNLMNLKDSQNPQELKALLEQEKEAMKRDYLSLTPVEADKFCTGLDQEMEQILKQ